MVKPDPVSNQSSSPNQDINQDPRLSLAEVLENLNTMQQTNHEAMQRLQAEQDRMAQLIDRMMKRWSMENPTP